MSYCRWNEDGSNVYVFEHCDAPGKILCYCCGLDGVEHFLGSRQEMIDHLKRHQELGHVVSPRAFKELQKEIEEGLT